MSKSSRSRKSGTHSGWWKQNRATVRFVALFLGLLTTFQVLYYEVIVSSAFFKAYLGVNTRAAVAMLDGIGEEVTATGEVMTSSLFTMSVHTGCDGLQAMAILVIAVLVFPGGGWKKVYAGAGGVVLIALLNVVRLVTLFWAGEHWPTMFQTLHVHLWPALLIIIALSYSIAWSAWATRAPRAA
jgi:exosortase/archaeosortase family protein